MGVGHWWQNVERTGRTKAFYELIHLWLKVCVNRSIVSVILWSAMIAQHFAFNVRRPFLSNGASIRTTWSSRLTRQYKFATRNGAQNDLIKGRTMEVVALVPRLFLRWLVQFFSHLGKTVLQLSDGFKLYKSSVSSGFFHPRSMISSNHENKSLLG